MTAPSSDTVALRRRDFVALGASGALTLLWRTDLAAAKGAHPKVAALPPRLAKLRRRTLGGLMDIDVGGLTATDRTRAVNRVEYVYRRSSPAVRARVEQSLDAVEAGPGGPGFSALGLEDRRAFVTLQEPPPGPIADFSVVQGFQRFVELQGAAVAAEAAVSGLAAEAQDPSELDAPDRAPAHDAGAEYGARRASVAEILRAAVRESRALALTAFVDDLEDD